MSHNMTIRLARISDAPAIHQLSTDLGYLYPAEKVAGRIERIMNETKDVLLVAEAEGCVIGYIHGTPYELLFHDPQVNILALVVAPAFRGFGVGGQLLDALEQWARDNGYSGIRLVSGSERLEAHRFYSNHGYENKKDQKNFSKRL